MCFVDQTMCEEYTPQTREEFAALAKSIKERIFSYENSAGVNVHLEENAAAEILERFEASDAQASRVDSGDLSTCYGDLWPADKTFEKQAQLFEESTKHFKLTKHIQCKPHIIQHVMTTLKALDVLVDKSLTEVGVHSDHIQYVGWTSLPPHTVEHIESILAGLEALLDVERGQKDSVWNRFVK